MNPLHDAATRVFALNELAAALSNGEAAVASESVRSFVRDIALPEGPRPQIASASFDSALAHIVALGPDRLAGILNTALGWADAQARADRLIPARDAGAMLHAIAQGQHELAADADRFADHWKVVSL